MTLHITKYYRGLITNVADDAQKYSFQPTAIDAISALIYILSGVMVYSQKYCVLLKMYCILLRAHKCVFTTHLVGL